MVRFSIIDDNSGFNTVRTVRLGLTLDSPVEFANNVVIGGSSDLFSSVDVNIRNDERKYSVLCVCW